MADKKFIDLDILSHYNTKVLSKVDSKITSSLSSYLPNTTKYGASIDLSLDSSTYVITAQLKDQNGNNLGTSKTIDLPLESVVVNGAYNNSTKKVVLTLKNGSTVDFSVADLVGGLQTEITTNNKLSVNLISGLSTVATSGSYNDLTNKPTIPTGAAADKGVVTTIDTSANLPTSNAVKTFVENKGYITSSGNITGNAATATTANTVNVTDTTPSSATTYYPLYTTGRTTEQTVRANQHLYYYDAGSWASLNLGASGSKGILTIHTGASSGDNYVDISPDTLTANRTLTIPDATGTIALTSGSVASAGKLTTARKIGLGTGVTGTATSFDGTGDITIPVTAIKESYLSWGGKGISGSISPIDAACSNIHNANRFAFAKPAGITIEYSTNGSSYSTYTTTNDEKIKLVSGIGNSYYIGARSTSTTVNDKLRITLNATNMGIYTRLQKLLLNISTSYATGSNVIVERAMKGSETTFTKIGTFELSGWSGWNSIPIGYAFGGGDSQTANIAVLRLTFGITGVNSNQTSNALQLIDIVGIGDTYWTYNSNMAKTGHIYSYDASQNATFPGAVFVPDVTIS